MSEAMPSLPSERQLHKTTCIILYIAHVSSPTPGTPKLANQPEGWSVALALALAAVVVVVAVAALALAVMVAPVLVIVVVATALVVAVGVVVVGVGVVEDAVVAIPAAAAVANGNPKHQSRKNLQTNPETRSFMASSNRGQLGSFLGL